MLDNITRDFAGQAERDQMLHTLGEGSRASLGNVQAALEMLDFPTSMRRARALMTVVRDEVRGDERARARLATRSAQTMKTRWPLEDMRGDDCWPQPAAASKAASTPAAPTRRTADAPML